MPTGHAPQVAEGLAVARQERCRRRRSLHFDAERGRPCLSRRNASPRSPAMLRSGCSQRAAATSRSCPSRARQMRRTALHETADHRRGAARPPTDDQCLQGRDPLICPALSTMNSLSQTVGTPRPASPLGLGNKFIDTRAIEIGPGKPALHRQAVEVQACPRR